MCREACLEPPFPPLTFATWAPSPPPPTPASSLLASGSALPPETQRETQLEVAREDAEYLMAAAILSLLLGSVVFCMCRRNPSRSPGADEPEDIALDEELEVPPVSSPRRGFNKLVHEGEPLPPPLLPYGAPCGGVCANVTLPAVSLQMMFFSVGLLASGVLALSLALLYT